MTCPAAPREARVEELHGHRVQDPYRWLEDEQDSRTRAFVQQQDAYFRAARDAWPDRGRWHRAVTERTPPQSVAPPVARGSRRFVLTQYNDAHAPVLLVTDTAGGTCHALDLEALCRGKGSLVRGIRPSWEGDRLVCMVSTGGSDRVTQHVLDAGTGEQIEPPLGPLPAAWVAWLPGSQAFYYVAFPDTAGDAVTAAAGLVVRLHRIGTGHGEDPVVFAQGGAPRGYLGMTIDPRGRWLAVTVSQGASSSNTLWLAPLGTGGSAQSWREVADEHFGAAVAPRFGPDGRLYLMTDHGAPRGRVCVTDPARPLPEHWQEVVAQDPEAVLDDCVLLDGCAAPAALALHTRHGISELSVHDTGHRRPPVMVELPGAGIVSALRSHPEGKDEAWLVYSDFVTPATSYRFDAGSGSLTRLALPGQGPPAGVRAVQSRLVDYRAGDGTLVRMFLLTPGREGPRPRPTIVSGYGGFGVPLRPVYSPVILAWVAAGGHYALACVRGGGEEGKAWHEAGRGANKKTAVRDFTAAADWLVRERFTEPGMLAAVGASHGGFLVAAAAMHRPDLYAAVLSADPLLDMVRYERFGIGTTWVEEFGSAGDREGLKDLLDISPYHNIREGTSYPAMLFSGCDDDPRLGSAHVRKMCAALQHAHGGKSPVLMRCEPGVGHGARTPCEVRELNVDTLAFLATHTGLELPPVAGVPRAAEPPDTPQQPPNGL